MKTRLPDSLAVLLLGAIVTPGLAAQSAKLAADIAFVRGLVSDLRFVDLAQYEVEQLKKTHRDSNDFKLVAQLAIEVDLEGAKRHPDRDHRRSLYKQAIEKSTAFIERYAGEPVAQDARVTLADSCIEFGYFLNEELEIAREEAPEKVADLEEEAATVFRLGVSATNKCEEAFKEAGRETDAFVSWMRRGILQREHGRAVEKDRGYLCDQAQETLENLILDVGEETILGQKALLEMAKIAEVKGDLDGAVQSYTDAKDAIYEALSDENLNLPESAQRLMFAMMQEIFDRLGTVSFKAGRTAEITDILAEYDKRIKEFNTEADLGFYDSLLITQAQVRAASSKQEDVSGALKTAKEINKNHPNDFVGLKAKNLIRNILRQSADLVTGDLLLEVAKGDYLSKNYDAAIAGFKRALKSMDAESKKRLGFETWEYIARCNERIQRYLEAAMAYSRAISDHAADVQTMDEANAEDLLKRTSTKAAYCMNKVMTASNRAAVFTSLKSTIDGQLATYNEAIAQAGDYAKGLRSKSQRKFEEAKNFFFSVQPDFDKYELARGHGIECLFRLGKFDEAKQQIAELRKYVGSHEIPEDERERRGYRPQALAWAHYTEGRILYEQTKGADGKPDLTKFKDVANHFLEFETLHEKHATLQMAKVHEMLGHAYLEMGDDEKATERYTKLKALGESTPDAHKALGALMFDTYRSQVKALEKELESLMRDGKSGAATLTKLRATEQKALNMGLDYAKTVGRPQYQILYNSLRIAEDLEAWPKCEWAAEKILKLYGKSKYSSLRQVKPLLGYALLRQAGRMQEALDILREAEKELADGKKTTAYYEVLRYKALALGGWPAFGKDGINYEPNPGMGKPDEAYGIYWGEEYRNFAKNSRRNPKYSLPWYRYHLEIYYFCRQAQRIDSKFKTRADTFYNIARSTDDFATLKGLGPEGVRIANLFNYIKP